MSALLHRIGLAAGHHPWRVIAAWVVVVVAAVMLSSAVGGEPDETFRLPGAESQVAADLLDDRFPQQSLYTADVVLHDEGGFDDDDRASVTAAVTELARADHVVSVTDPFDARSPAVSPGGTVAVATVAYDQEIVTSAMFDDADGAFDRARDAGVQVEYDGSLGYAAGSEGGGEEMIGILIAIVVLAIAFGSLVAVSLPVGVTLLAILLGTSLLGILSGFAPVPEIASIIGLMLGLGVGIDYALFVLTRHRQHLDEGLPVSEAVARANATAGASVVFAGTTVMLAIIGVRLSGIPILAMMGWGAAIMVAVTVLAAVTLLPALLGLLKHRVDRLRVPFVRRRRTDVSATASARWTRRVIARPKLFGAVAALVLVALAVPTLSMRLAFPDAGNDPAGSTTREAYDLIAEGFGPGTSGQLLVTLESEDGPVRDADLAAVSGALAASPGVASVAPPAVNDARDLAVVAITPTSGPQDEQTSELLARLRHETLPEATADRGLTPRVTGSTAIVDDVSRQLQDRMPIFLAAVIGLSFLVLTMVFRSVLVPLKAALLNLLSVGASYGVVVAVFQWGWGSDLIGVEQELPIMPLAPMLMFAILFGLSMDYEVFLLSRVREFFHACDDRSDAAARSAVVSGVGATGRVITSAAVIMMAVFGSFLLAPDPTTKMFGLGLGVAVLLDVTLVRMVLVPAVMSVLGARAWWIPRWLDRILPAAHGEGDIPEEALRPAPAACA